MDLNVKPSAWSSFESWLVDPPSHTNSLPPLISENEIQGSAPSGEAAPAPMSMEEESESDRLRREAIERAQQEMRELPRPGSQSPRPTSGSTVQARSEEGAARVAAAREAAAASSEAAPSRSTAAGVSGKAPERSGSVKEVLDPVLGKSMDGGTCCTIL